jgi:myo-inositol 2-dehydrogenase / D-chiro-inositol 1-dehydrogenase
LMAIGGALVDPQIAALGDIDTAMVMLETVSGVQCQIINSRRAIYGYDQRVELFGSRGLLRADNQHVTSLYKLSEDGSASSPINHFFLDRYEKAYINELNDFIDAVMGKAVMMPGGDDGVRALQLAEAAAESLKTCAVIELKFA